ncbi:MAG: glycerate kinase [Scrofimicrobium sp.]
MSAPRILIAPDSFKESMTARQASEAIARGVHSVWPSAQVTLVPMADGGEGTLDAVLSSGRFEEHTCRVTTAYDKPRTARFGWDPTSRAALIETAEAAGLEHTKPEERDIWLATSYGVGELIRAALDLDPTTIYLTLGGSATNDAGTGMLAALGVRFLDRAGQELGPTPEDLGDLYEVDLSALDPRTHNVAFELAVDVENPLLGDEGASAVFGPQKGASADDIKRLDALLEWIADLLSVKTGADSRDVPGSGAAGGMGWAAMEVLTGTPRPGVEIVAEMVGLVEAMKSQDLVITGEGRVDPQTLSGKTAYGVAQVAKACGIPVLLLAGSVLPGAERLLEHGVTAIVPISDDAESLEERLARGEENLEHATARTLSEHPAFSDLATKG